MDFLLAYRMLGLRINMLSELNIGLDQNSLVGEVNLQLVKC